MGSKPFSVNLSAPGKIILFGEYSVVFNKPALAGTLCLRTKLNLTESSDHSICLSFSALNLDVSFPLNDVKNHFRSRPSSDNWQDYLQSLRNSLVALCEGQPTRKVLNLADTHTNSLIAFFHVFKNCFETSPGFTLRIDSDLAIGSGVGSSASFSVVLAAAVLLYEYHLKGNSINNVIKRNESVYSIAEDKWINQISEIAYSCEKIFHGSPSGVDNNTVLRGSMLEFVRSSDGDNKMRSIIVHPVNILLVNTNVQRSTKTLVENVRQLLKNHPEIIECVLNAMENIARKAVKILNLKGTKETEDQFGELITLNHNLLRVLGVSHPTLEHIVSIANKHKLNAKLTGAGGGGFAFVYLPSWVDEKTTTSIKKELCDAGYTASELSLGGPGLTIEQVVY